MLENKDLSYLIKKSKQVVAVLFTRDAATFLFFLILAFMFWLMHSSSAERNMKMKVPIIYTGIPQQIDFLDSLPKSVTVILRDKGSLLWPYYFKDIHPITIDLTNSFSGSGNLDYSMTESVNQLLTQFPGTTILQDIEFSHFGVAYRV